MKTYWVSGGIAPLIVNLGTKWRWVVSLMLHPLCSRGKSPLYPMGGELGGPQNRSGRDGKEKNSHHCHCREMNAGLSAHSVILVSSLWHACSNCHGVHVLQIKISWCKYPQNRKIFQMKNVDLSEIYISCTKFRTIKRFLTSVDFDIRFIWIKMNSSCPTFNENSQYQI
jgi:hypothetical protein